MKRIPLFVWAVVIAIAAPLVIACCGEPKVVKADTGEIVQESNKLNVRMYDPSGDNNAFDVIELKRGPVTYLIILRSQTGLQIVNYTLDSLEVAFHKEHLDKAFEEGFQTNDLDLVIRSTKNTNSWCAY
jgi:hypothetical protein